MDRPSIELSIHDVMPSRLTAVQSLIDQTQRLGWPPPLLLVVPGLGWDTAGINQLQRWQTNGHELAGHGWFHRISAYGGLKHRLHAALISRQAAEHLSLRADAIIALMQRCYAWFGEHDLATPTRYVPPAWALGPISIRRLGEQPFAEVETLRGIINIATGRWSHGALLGYEAGNRLQRYALSVSNALNRQHARRAGLRIGLHPDDAQLPLADWLWHDLTYFSPLRLTGD